MEHFAAIVDYIVCYAADHDISLSAVRLVKFLYLADLYYARANEGKTLSGFPWRFVHYGPFCSEALDVIKGAVDRDTIIQKPIPSKFIDGDFFLYSCNVPMTDELRNAIPIEVLSQLNGAIRRLGEDTPALLDYVYFGTEPMEDVRPGQILDFTKARPLQPEQKPPKIHFTREQVSSAKEHLKRLSDKVWRNQRASSAERIETRKWKDNLYYQTLNSIEEEELPSGITGIARIVE